MKTVVHKHRDNGLEVFVTKLLAVLGTQFDRLLSFTGFVSILMMASLSLFISTQVVCRYFFSLNVPGLFDLSIYTLILFTFIAAAYTFREGQQISVDFLTKRMSQSARIGLKLASYTASLLFLAVLTRFSFKWALNSYFSGSMTISEMPLPKWILISSIPLGSGLLSVQIFRELFGILSTLFNPSGSKNQSRLNGKVLSLSSFIFIAGIGAALFLAVNVNEILGICVMTFFVLLCGMPVFLGLGFAGSAGMYFLISETTLRQLPFLAYKSVESFPLTCLPLFIIAGIIMEKGKIVEAVFSFFRYFAGNFISAPLVSTILVGGFFCAISGSSVATTSLIAAVSLPILISSGYKKSISSGVVAGSTIGTVIPPSIGYVLYGVITEESIGQLFIAGILPAVMIFGFYCFYIIIRAQVSPDSLFEKKGPDIRTRSLPCSHEKDAGKFGRALFGLCTPAFVLGGIYLGIFTPTEAAAVMVIYAVVITVLVMKTMDWYQIYDAFLSGTKVSAMILIIIVGARIFGALTSQMGIAADLVAFINRADISPVKALLIVSSMLIILGMFLDAASIMVITLPVFHPVITAAGFNPVWFGVFFIIVLEIGLLTPPVGLNLFIIKGLSDFGMASIVKGTFPFVLILLFSLLLMVLFPQLATWMPSLMMKF